MRLLDESILRLFRIEGPAQVGISGGRTSALLGDLIVQAHSGKVPDDVFFTFQNTGKEREETLVFVDRLERRWGKKIHWSEWCGVYGVTGRAWKEVDFASASRNGEPFDMVLRYYDEYRSVEKNEPPILPNVVNRYCSDRMKTAATIWFMRERGFDEWDAYLGIRRDEHTRYARMMAANEKRANRFTMECPLYIAGITKNDVNAYWATQDFDLGINSDAGNCDGCFLKHPDKLIRSFQSEPERADWWSAHEERTGQRWSRSTPSFKELKWVAIQRNKQMPLLPVAGDDEEQSLTDCMCGD